MMVTFVAECEKKALPRTRRVLDAFANRIGSRTWQTVITEDGLQAVKTLLRSSASKNTAVACHWIRSRSRSELLWIVGNRRKFNAEGVVPVNYTEGDMIQFTDKSQWQTLKLMQYSSAMAGLFHDIGKANILFQKKLNPDAKTEVFEPYRHEWLSFRLFQRFVSNKSDEEWLQALGDVQEEAFSGHFKDGVSSDDMPQLSTMPPLAKFVAWLIVTHHKLPLYPAWQESSPPSLTNIDEWLDRNFEALWNSYHCKDADQQERKAENWQLADLPVKSMQWRSKACLLSSEALVELRPFLNAQTDWLHEQLFSTHIARLGLMLSDHYYSSLTLKESLQKGRQWRNPHYKIYANTDWIDGKKQYKQQLDEHLIGVSHFAEDIVKALPRLNHSLASLEPDSELTSNVPKKCKASFGWQDEARKLAENVGKDTLECGFLGINMASTGKGKTRANAKIMTALGQQTGRVRFSVALGLRVLTLQTGKAYRDELNMSDEDLAIAVGGTAVKQLFEKQQAKAKMNSDNELSPEVSGSESQEALLPTDLYVHYKGTAESHALSQWTQQEKGLDALLQAPVLVSTIDHLMPATEGTSGGKQIPATLRLLTSDLVLDEPDDFGLEDLPALCRLVHWAGMLGSRVLLSTATIPPALAYALFQAYQAGWKEYAKANIANWSGEICCAWFDERKKGCRHGKYKVFADFKKDHDKFVKHRGAYLRKQPAKRQAEIIDVEHQEDKTIAVCMADAIQSGAIRLHQEHALSRDGKTLSVGLVRMANINPLVAVAKAMIKLVAPQDTAIHYCVYHSRYPLAIRSAIEHRLDKVLNRKNPDNIWSHEEIKQVMQKHPDAKHHMFIVLASPVAEVGRDHDYDWAIVEPSSMRSIIQLAGRVLRHREVTPEAPNILLLHKNYKWLSGKDLCFQRPGFESAKLKLEKKGKSLLDVLDEAQYRQTTAIQRIELPEAYKERAGENLVCLEHKALQEQLFGNSGAKLWWKNHPHWCGEVQRQQRFRDSQKDEACYLWLDDASSQPKWKWKNERVFPPVFGEPPINIKHVDLEEPAAGNDFWFEQDAKTVYQQLSEDFDWDLATISQQFGEVRITAYRETEEYNYHSHFGIYQDIGA